MTAILFCLGVLSDNRCHFVPECPLLSLRESGIVASFGRLSLLVITPFSNYGPLVQAFPVTFIVIVFSSRQRLGLVDSVLCCARRLVGLLHLLACNWGTFKLLGLGWLLQACPLV